MGGVDRAFQNANKNSDKEKRESPMPGDDNVQEPFYFDEVIGSALSYHRPTCHIVEQIRRRNYKRLRNWQEAVSLGLSPCPHCRPAFIPKLEPATKETATNAAPLTSSQLADLRRGLLRLLDEIDTPLADEGLAQRINRLSRNSAIPRGVAACMHMIREFRNVSEYEAKTISEAETQTIKGAVNVIREWAHERKVTLPHAFSEIFKLS
jgi:hypothetical protein